MKELIGFKVLDLECKNQEGIQYQIGKTTYYDKKMVERLKDTLSVKCEACDGLYFTTKADNVFYYLPQDLLQCSRFFLVKAEGFRKVGSGYIVENNYYTNKLTLLRELSLEEILSYTDPDNEELVAARKYYEYVSNNKIK